MIDKTEAQTNGYRVVELSTCIDEECSSRLKTLKNLIPAFVNSDNAVNIDAIVDFAGPNNATSSNKGYELTFAGKGLARHLADLKTRKELKAELKQSKNFNETENLIIRGDNLDALKILRQSYYGKIKMIYIDPPYNTRTDEFIYADNFHQNTEGLTEHLGLEEKTFKYIKNMYGTRTHSGWLAFMYPRLKLARDLLTNDGVIFISIDDNEQANLKIICDEIFGEENFISSIVWHRKDNASFLSKKIVSLKEYILFYQKSNDFAGTTDKKKDTERHRELINISNAVQERTLDKEATLVVNSSYSDIVKKGKYGDPKFEIEILDDFEVIEGKPSQNIKMKGRFSWSQRKIDEEISKKGKIEIKTIKKFKPIFIRDYSDTDTESRSFYRPMIDILSKKINEETQTTHDASKQLENLFGKAEIFSNPKPVGLLVKLLSNITKFSDNDIILDFFAGSGTTAQAVMELNKKEGGGENSFLFNGMKKLNKKTNLLTVSAKNTISSLLFPLFASSVFVLPEKKQNRNSVC